jgi:ribonuclease R
MCLRSFKKAVYAVENIGHYALAFESYCHFTSPIRRYPDLLVHRLVKRALKLKEYAKVEMRLDYLDALARQSSGLEQRAEQAERTLHSRKCARFLAQRIGDGFPAVVTGASHGGVFVQLLETGMEGFLPIRELGDDYYTYEPERFALVGSRSGRVFGPGTEIDVLVSSVDIDRSDVIFTLDRNAKPGASAEKNELSGVGQSISADLARLSSRSGGKKAKSGGSKGPSKMGKADRGKRPDNEGRDSKKKPQRSKRR